MNHLLNSAIVLCGLFPTVGKAISVQLRVIEVDYCSQGNGFLFAEVTGGTAPYTYDWYKEQGGNWVQVCTHCLDYMDLAIGSVNYKVVVTDALSATAEAMEQVPDLSSVSINGGQYPYLAGTPPVVSYEFLVDLFGPVSYESHMAPVGASGQFVSPAGSNTTYTCALPIGTDFWEIEAWATAPPSALSCPSDHMGLSIDPPTVLPTLAPLQITPSCSNGSTGRVEFTLTNGTIPGGIYVYLKDSAGTVMARRTYYSNSMPTASGAFQNVAQGTYWLVVTGLPQHTPMNFGIPGFIYTCQDSIAVTVPSTGVPCGQVQGSVFIDTNADCTLQWYDTSVPGVILKVEPGPVYATTSSTGTYALQLPAGEYTIEEQHPLIGQSCSVGPIPFTVPATTAPVTVNVPCTSTVAMDADIMVASGPARPGFELRYALLARNNTPVSTGTTTTTVQLDPLLSFVSAEPAPSVVSGNTLTWNQTALTAFRSRTITITAQIPADVGLFGTELVTTAALATAAADGDLANNQAVSITTVTGSYDPNDKLALSSSGSRTHYDPVQDDWIDYTIRFQNTGTDTAFHVWITDTLAATLDAATFRIGAASHPFTWELDGKGVLKVRFTHILLPDSNVNEPRSHGFVNFRIQPRYPVVVGTTIENTANIFFDFNPPVITDPSMLTVPTPPVLVSPRLYLGGAYASATMPPMNDALRVLNKIPRVEPYGRLGYAHRGADGGVVAGSAAFLVTGDNAVVDWVVVELRQPTSEGSVVASRAALVQRDGDVVGPDGLSPVAFHVPGGSYRLAVRHRNHLGVMTASPIPLTTTTTTVDFTQASTVTYGTNARNNVNGTMVLWPGDVDGDGIIKYTGADNDRDPILRTVGGSVPTNVMHDVYDVHDVNLDGKVMYTGAGNDRDPILQTVGGSVPTAVRRQQLP